MNSKTPTLPEGPEKAGFLLKNILLAKGISVIDAAAALTATYNEYVASLPKSMWIDPQTIFHNQILEWQRGNTLIFGELVPHLRKALGLKDKEYDAILKARFPSLDEAWLAAQPAEKQDIAIFSDLLSLSGLFTEGNAPAPIPVAYDRMIEDRQRAKDQAYINLGYRKAIARGMDEVNRHLDPAVQWLTPERRAKFLEVSERLEKEVADKLIAERAQAEVSKSKPLDASHLAMMNANRAQVGVVLPASEVKPQKKKKQPPETGMTPSR